MNEFLRAVVAGGLGSIATNVFHEVARRSTPNAPRVDLLGMQAFAKSARRLNMDSPTGSRLYLSTLVADLLANGAYFALVATARRERRLARGALLGIVAGIGAIALPGRFGLASQLTARNAKRRSLTLATYAIGGLVAGAASRARSIERSVEETFAGKHVLVTGGTRGLGFEIARQLIACGARVTICGRSQQTLDRAIAALDPSVTSLAGFTCDVGLAGACDRLIASATTRFGAIDVLINNAGIISVGPLANVTLDDMHDVLATNLWGTVNAVFAVLPAMRERASGAIVNITSVGGTIAVPHMLPYSTSKFAQLGFTRGLASELAPCGIRVTCVVPGLMVTGSPDRATFKGQYRKEYAWFAASDANPLLAVPAEKAARRILRGVARGRSTIEIGWTASVPRMIAGLLPRATATAVRVAATLLPRGTDDLATRRRGFESRSPIVDLVTGPSDREGRRNNEG